MNEIRLKYTRAQRQIYLADNIPKFSIIPKGRQMGATQGGIQWYIENAIDGVPLQLWVDTINGNIDRYFDRVFHPILSQLTTVKWDFNRQKRELKVGKSIIDFRSSDNPENIEGFNYWNILMNEAGIILKDDYLFTNTILPMMLRHKESKLIAIGVPKGIHKKNGDVHKFYELNQKAISGQSNYRSLHFTSYDNPSYVTKEEVDKMILEMAPQEVQQEIFGEFIEYSGNNPYAHNFIPKNHEGSVAMDMHKQMFVSIDFNLNPFACIFAHKWRDGQGEHVHVFDEIEIQNGSTEKLLDVIIERYRNFIPTMQITGDYTGRKRQQGLPDLASQWLQIERGLAKYGFRSPQLRLKPNPFHTNARNDINYFLYHFPDFKINPVKCVNLCRDMRIVQVDNFGEIIKQTRTDASQRADYMDCLIYLVSNFCGELIDRHQKTGRW